jgi:YedE family putative selenium metabolism protein
MENFAGALGLHGNIRMQYLRPDILGFVLGSFLMTAVIRRDFSASGGSSPLLRFLIGILLIIGCSVFIGCPVKMILRLAAGDIGAIIGFVGLLTGIYIGLEFVENGFQLGVSSPTPRANGLIIPGIMFFLLINLLLQSPFLLESSKGAAALHAPLLLSLGVGLVIGAMANHTKFCITGGFARIFLWGPREVMNCPRSSAMLLSIAAFIISAFIANLLSGQFSFGLHGQPSSNESFGWAFLGMLLVGFGSVLIRGCPLRQLTAAGDGDTDAGATVMGMLVGAALVQNWNMAGTAEGTPFAAKVAVLAGICILFTIGALNRKRGYGIAPEYQRGLD